MTRDVDTRRLRAGAVRSRAASSSSEALRARAAPAHRRRQDVPDHHRRSHASAAWSRAIRWSARWQVPVADAAVTATSFDGYTGEAMAMGERTPLALLDAAASARMAVGEAHHQHRRARRSRSSRDIKLSRQLDGRRRPPRRRRAPLRRRARRRHRALPRARHRDSGRQGLDVDAHGLGRGRREERSVTAPLSLIVSAFAPVTRRAARAHARAASRDGRTAELLLIDLGRGQEPPGRLGAGQVYGSVGERAARSRRPGAAGAASSRRSRSCNAQGCCSPITIAPTAACSSRCSRWRSRAAAGLDDRARRARAATRSRALFNEELGAVLQVRDARRRRACASCFARARARPTACTRSARRAARRSRRDHAAAAKRCSTRPRSTLRALWSETTHAMQRLRDDADLRRRRAGSAPRRERPGPVGAAHASTRTTTSRRRSSRAARAPRVAILREQGVNGQIEMAAAFDRAGFDAVDVHMSDILERPRRPRRTSAAWRPAAASPTATCSAPAKAGPSRSCSTRARATQFAAFFARADTFALGVCNGCQMLSNLKELIPGAERWPRFVRNRSEQFEARAVAWCEIERQPVGLAARHGRLAAADRGRARRRPRRVR